MTVNIKSKSLRISYSLFILWVNNSIVLSTLIVFISFKKGISCGQRRMTDTTSGHLALLKSVPLNLEK